jgi:hypothetical protein
VRVADHDLVAADVAGHRLTRLSLERASEPAPEPASPMRPAPEQ